MKPPTPLTPEQSQLAADNQGLVWRVALKLQGRGIDLDDLVGWGQFGLLHACRKFDPKREIQFSTYATWCIRGSILKAIAERSRMIRVPAHLQAKPNRGTWQTCQLLADDDLGTPLCELAVQARPADPLEEAEREAEIARMLHSLTPRESTILRLRFGIGHEKQSLAEVGSKFGITKERVRQLAAKAIRALREQVEASA